MELEVSEQVGAGRYERTPERKTYRNGYRERVWETRVGQIPLRVPKLRQGSYFPSLLTSARSARRRGSSQLLSPGGLEFSQTGGRLLQSKESCRGIQKNVLAGSGGAR
jgi:hypothetical protein